LRFAPGQGDDSSPRRIVLNMLDRMIFPVLAILAAMLAASAPALAQAAPAPIDSALVRRYFLEAGALVDRDSGRLWGRSLAGPLLFVDAATRAVVATEADHEGQLGPLGSMYWGTLPPSVGAANTAVHWAGVHWTMVLWPLPADSLERQVLLAHELWHRIQDSLGFPAASPANAHLATAEGRLWLRIEGRALRRALGANGAARTRALQDAVAFRRARRARFPGSDSTERALELHEGLAAYTGVALAAPALTDRSSMIASRLEAMEHSEHFERGFAYQTGPAYGFFLDAVAPQWRGTLSARDDLAERLGRAIGVRSVQGTPAARAAAYGYAAVRRDEASRFARAGSHRASLRVRFVTGPVLELPLTEAKSSFDPGQVEALEPLGSVYGSLRLADRWGVLQCDASGGVIAPDWSRAIVPAPADTAGRRLTGAGWILELAPNWRVVPGRRKGDWTLRPPVAVVPPTKR
jgi:hypothetical protein